MKNKFGDKMKKFLQSKKVYFIYAILFIFIAIVVFAIFFKNQCSFIWQADGLKQHYIILKDFNEKIRSFLTNPSGGLDLFSWNMGLGMDIIGQYSYYVLGDPFAYLSLLFPMQYLEYSYTFLILLRIFCIGLAFIVYGKYYSQCKNAKENSDKKASSYNLLIGAIIYTFCAFSLFAGVRHPYFLNAMILFPLLLLGVDKLFVENRKVPLAIFVAISAISNYYFFYMHTIMIILYAILRYFFVYRKEGVTYFFKKLGGGILTYIIGILIAGVILFPTIYAFLNSARSGEEAICQYGLDYYKSLFSINLLTAYGDNWSFVGVSSIILLMLPILWIRKKKHPIYFSYFLIATVILIVPFLGSVMNGFSFPNNRWSFMYSFILSYIVTLCLDKKYTQKEIKYMCLFLALYSIVASVAVLCIKSMSCFVIYLIQIVVAFLMLITILYQNYKDVLAFSQKEKSILHKIKIRKFETIILLLVVSNITVMAYGLYSSYDRNYAKQFITLENCEEKLATQLGKNKNYAKNIESILERDKTFYRISKIPHQVQNLSIYYHYPSTECFLSIGNKYVYSLNTELADNNYSTTSCIRGIGDRTKISTLLGNKYYIADEKHKINVPYGYHLLEENNDVYTYENNFPLSIGVAYNEYLLREDYEKLTPIEKEEALLKAAVIDSEDELNGFIMQKKEDVQDIKNCYEEVQYEIIDKDKLLKENKKEILTKQKNQSISLDISEIQDAELYVYISGFEFKGDNKHTITANFQGKDISKSIENRVTSAYYQKAPEILLNLGYYEKAEGKIKLTFSTKGTYQFEQIQVIAVPMENYEEVVKGLQKAQLKEVSCTNKEIKGKIELEQNSILQIATSYTTGWKAYIDGKQVDTIRVNTAFIGIPVESGKHEIKLEYKVPYLQIGAICSAIGVAGLIFIIVIEKRKKL